jgi:hypothetical protein
VEKKPNREGEEIKEHIFVRAIVMASSPSAPAFPSGMPLITPVDVILYHFPCTDGASSAYVLTRYCEHHFGVTPQCVGVAAAGLGPEDDRVRGKAVVAVDVLPKNHEAIARLASSFVVLDHHESNIEQLASTTYGVYGGRTVSGVGMAWAYAYGSYQGMPLALQYVQDRDLFRFPSDESKFVALAIKDVLDVHDLPFFFEKMDALTTSCPQSTELVLDEYKAFGRLYDELLTRRAQAMLRAARPRTLRIGAAELKCLVFNALPDLVSHLGDLGMGTPGIDLVCVWRLADAASATPYNVSLRSRDTGADTIPVARHLGISFGAAAGGGHRNASGCNLTALPDTLFKL